MRTTSLKSIYLEHHELKEAIIQHLFQCGHKELAEHLNISDYETDWTQDGKELIIAIDGEFPETEDIRLQTSGDSLLEARKKEYALEEDGENDESSDKIIHTNEPIKPIKTWTAVLKEAPGIGIYIELPPELLGVLGWTEGTLVQWEETEVCGNTGEHKGLILEKVSDALIHSGEQSERP